MRLKFFRAGFAFLHVEPGVAVYFLPLKYLPPGKNILGNFYPPVNFS
jgi:hypothetical protein